MHYFLPRSIQLAIALAGSILLSACGIFSSEYNLNASEDRPLYESDNQPSADNDTASDEDAGEDRELIFEDDTETEPDNKTSELPDIPKTEEALLRQEAVNYAKTFMGTKYKLGGTTPRGGFDCSGFTSYVMKKVDVAISRTSQAQENNGKKVRAFPTGKGLPCIIGCRQQGRWYLCYS
jgi:cell wall-associated NlpC family hydrolase